MNDLTIKNEEQEKVILVGLFGPDLSREEAQEHINELERLTDTAGGVVVKKILQNRTHPDPDTYIGRGKIEELQLDVTMTGADTIIVDDDLTPAQIRNIQKATKAKIIDRSGLILDIFASRAKTAAAKTQVELAQLQYLLPRLTRAWTHLSRQKGGIGTKGPGETQIETDRRMIGTRIATLKEKLLKLDTQRDIQRKRRSMLTRIALVGYTNAGKSSLLNVLAQTQKLAEDRLFATLDSTVRRLDIDIHQTLLSDTVGFIRKLPHNLIESFKSTLDEIREADILLHIVDASSPVMEDYIRVVKQTLVELNADKKPMILVFNKVDRITNRNDLSALKRFYPDAILISAKQQIGLDRLLTAIKMKIEESFIKLSMQLSASQYKAISFIHDVANVSKVAYKGNEVMLTFNIHEKDKRKLEKVINDYNNESS